MGFSKQEYWSGLPFTSPGDLSDPGIKPGSLALQADSLPSEPAGKQCTGCLHLILFEDTSLPLPHSPAQFSPVQSLSHVRHFVTPQTAACQASLSITNSRSLLKLMSFESTESVVDHPTISSSVIPFSSRLQSFRASGSFPMNQFFASGGQSIRVSASASVLPMNIQD